MKTRKRAYTTNMAYRRKHQLSCKHCGVTFGTKRKTTLYCSDACRQASHRAKTPSVAHKSPCVVCGDVFSHITATKHYCSNKCRQKAYRQKLSNRRKTFKPSKL